MSLHYLHIMLCLYSSKCTPFLFRYLNCKLFGSSVIILLHDFTVFRPKKTMTVTGYEGHTLYKLSIKNLGSLSLASNQCPDHLHI